MQLMRTLASIFLILFYFSVQAQKIDDVFKKMPEEIVSGITEGNRTMLLINKDETSVPYTFGEIKKIKHTANYIKLQTSAVGTTEIKLLPFQEDKNIICVIKTICAKVRDSQVSFYTENWEKLNPKDYILLNLETYFLNFDKKVTSKNKYALSLPDIYPISAEFEEKEDIIRLVFNYKQRLTKEQIEQMAPYIKTDTMRLRWNGKAFR